MAGYSHLATELRRVGAFNRILLRNVGDVILTQGATPSLRVEAAPHLLPEVISRVQDGCLLLGVGHTWWEAITTEMLHPRGYVIYRVTVADLDELEIHGTGEVECARLVVDRLRIKAGGMSRVRIANLQADYLRVEIGGQSHFDLGGQVRKQEVFIKGLADYDASKLRSDFAEVDIGGKGHAVVWVEKDLLVYIAGLGTVEYYGNPTVREDISGLSHIKALGEPIPA
jgi:hypothetical protein